MAVDLVVRGFLKGYTSFSGRILRGNPYDLEVLLPLQSVVPDLSSFKASAGGPPTLFGSIFANIPSSYINSSPIKIIAYVSLSFTLLTSILYPTIEITTPGVGHRPPGIFGYSTSTLFRRFHWSDLKRQGLFTDVQCDVEQECHVIASLVLWSPTEHLTLLLTKLVVSVARTLTGKCLSIACFSLSTYEIYAVRH
jgi:hypothetical protein